MAAPEKPSVSGYMEQSHEVSRFENLYYKAINTAYYNNSWGLDWVFWLDDKLELPLNGFVSYMVQEAMIRGIVIENVQSEIREFTLQMTVRIQGVTFSTAQPLEFN